MLRVFRIVISSGISMTGSFEIDASSAYFLFHIALSKAISYAFGIEFLPNGKFQESYFVIESFFRFFIVETFFSFDSRSM